MANFFTDSDNLNWPSNLNKIPRGCKKGLPKLKDVNDSNYDSEPLFELPTIDIDGNDATYG